MNPAAMASCRFSTILLLLLLTGVFMFGSEHAEAKKEVVTARKEDIPFIKCSVCEAIAKQLVRQVKEKREKTASKKVFLPRMILKLCYIFRMLV